jgi:hypothetical protein
MPIQNRREPQPLLEAHGEAGGWSLSGKAKRYIEDSVIATTLAWQREGQCRGDRRHRRQVEAIAPHAA